MNKYKSRQAAVRKLERELLPLERELIAAGYSEMDMAEALLDMAAKRTVSAVSESALSGQLATNATLWFSRLVTLRLGGIYRKEAA